MVKVAYDCNAGHTDMLTQSLLLLEEGRKEKAVFSLGDTSQEVLLIAKLESALETKGLDLNM